MPLCTDLVWMVAECQQGEVSKKNLHGLNFTTFSAEGNMDAFGNDHPEYPPPHLMSLGSERAEGLKVKGT